MRGFVAFLVVGAVVALLIPFPFLLPIAVVAIIAAGSLPRDRGGKLNGRSGL